MRRTILFASVLSFTALAQASAPSLPANPYPGFKKSGAPQDGVATEYSDTTQLKLPMPKVHNACMKVAVAVDSKEELVGQVDFGSGREKIYSGDKPGLLTMQGEYCGDQFGDGPIQVIIRRTSGTGSDKLSFPATAQVYVQARSAGKRAATHRALDQQAREFKKKNRAQACKACRFEPDSCLIRQGLTRADCG